MKAGKKVYIEVSVIENSKVRQSSQQFLLHTTGLLANFFGIEFGGQKSKSSPVDFIPTKSPFLSQSSIVSWFTNSFKEFPGY
jgi:hypothetical protein